MEKTLTRGQMLLGICLAVVLGVSTGLFVPDLVFRPKPFEFQELATRTKSGPVDLKLAKESLETYRKEGALAALGANSRGKTKGILHDTAAFNKLYKEVFLKFTASHEPRKNYEWRLGLYPNIVYEDDGTEKVARINVYFIPTMYDTANNITLDYLEEIYKSDTPYKKIKPGSRWNAAASYIFDQGTLFP